MSRKGVNDHLKSELAQSVKLFVPGKIAHTVAVTDA